MTDTFKTINTPTEPVLFKEKKSKFIGYAYPIIHEDEVKELVESLKKEHHTANHVCYAWQVGTQDIRYRANDDGEPNNSAGMPIYGQLQAFEVTNILVAVVRIFGGTKLGVGGLISAYKTAAQQTLENATIVTKIETTPFKVTFTYPHMNTVMRAIKKLKLTIAHQKLETSCEITLSVRNSDIAMVVKHFSDIPHITSRILED